MTSNDKFAVSAHRALKLIFKPLKLMHPFIELVSRIVVFNVVHGVEDEDGNVLRDICSVVATVHHSVLDSSVFDKLFISWLVIEPQIVQHGVVDWFLGLVGG